MTELYEGGPTLQELIDRGAWSLEGSAGRAMMAAIDAGEAMLGRAPARDYWGNLIPAWWMVAPGTKGSPEFVGHDRPEEPSDDEKRMLLAEVGCNPILPSRRTDAEPREVPAHD